MREIFAEYGSVLITVVAVMLVILVITAVIGQDEGGLIGQAFSNLINNFIQRANASAGVTIQ